MKRIVVTILLLLAVFSSGCQETSETTKVSTIEASIDGTKIVVVKSDAYRLDGQEAEVFPILEEWLQREDIEVVKLSTIYVEGYLIGFEICYKEEPDAR